MSKKIADILGTNSTDTEHAEESFTLLGHPQQQANDFIERMAGNAQTDQQLTARQLVEKSKPIKGTRADQALSAIVGGKNKTDLGLAKTAGRQAGSRGPKSRSR